MGNVYGAGSGRIWLDDVHCYGTELDLADCRHNHQWGKHDCAHNEDVSISCNTGNIAMITNIKTRYGYREEKVSFSSFINF